MNLPATRAEAVDHSERAHAILSPSRSKQWLECPASAYWTAKLPENEPGPDALFGTKAHQYAEKALNRLVADKSPSKVLDSIPDERMRDIVEGYVLRCQKLLLRVRRTANARIVGVYVEQKVALPPPHGTNVWGTSDFGIVFEVNGYYYIVVDDLKTGAYGVSARKNTQLLIYAAGLAELHRVQPKKVWCYIDQPKVHDTPQHDVYSAEEFEEELVVIKAGANRALRVIQDPVAPKADSYSPGDHCRFCIIEGTCKARQQRFKQAGVALLKGAQFPDPELLTTAQKVKIYGVKSECEDFLKAVEHSLLTDLLKGREVDGYKLVPSRANRSWIEDEDRIVSTLEKAGVKAYTKKLIPFGEAERALKRLGKEDRIEKLLTKGEGKLQIASEDDPRNAVESDGRKLLKEAGDGSVDRGNNAERKRSKKISGRQHKVRENERRNNRTGSSGRKGGGETKRLPSKSSTRSSARSTRQVTAQRSKRNRK